jgi:hypothetical protein
MGNKTTEVNDLAVMCDAILENDDWRNRMPPKCECCGSTCGNYTRSFGTREALTLCAACWAMLASLIFDDWKQHRPPWADDTEVYIDTLKKSFQESKENEQ